jgi:D-3-phosphoglycerate dehydrogenase
VAPTVVIAYLDIRDVPERLEPLEALGARVVRTHSLAAPELAPVLPEAGALIVELNAVPEPLLDRLPCCRIIACASTGYDYVAWQAAAQRGVWVTHVPDYCTEEVATHTIALLLSQARRLPGLFAQVRQADWNPLPVRPIRRLQGQTLGIIGLGRIGKSVARKAQGLGLRVIAHDPYVAEAIMTALGVVRVSREDLLRRADYVTLHTPLTAETEGMLDGAALALMPPHAVLINTARGRLVDEAALLAAVRAGRLAAAALDVLAEEPPPADHPLLAEPRIHVTPHSAWCSEEADQEVWRRAAEDVARVLQGRPPLHAVAEIQAPTQAAPRGSDSSRAGLSTG